MTIAIIGAGAMGGGLARLFTASGLDVVIGHRDPVKAAALAKEVSPKIKGVGTAAAVAQAETVVFAVPFRTTPDAIRDAGNLTGKIIIDISNPITADYKDLTIGHTTSSAEEVQKLALGAKVVKAYNTIFAQLLPAEARKGRTIQVFVAGDDAAAKAAVSKIVAATGFEPIESGALSNCRYLEPVCEMAIHFGFFLGWGPTVAVTFAKGEA